jgi:hypothetical protein
MDSTCHLPLMVTALQSSSSKQAPKCAAAGKQQQQDVVLYFGVIDILQVRATVVCMFGVEMPTSLLDGHTTQLAKPLAKQAAVRRVLRAL